MSMQEAYDDEQGNVPIDKHGVAIKQIHDKRTNKHAHSLMPPGELASIPREELASRRARLEKSSVERRPNLPK